MPPGIDPVSICGEQDRNIGAIEAALAVRLRFHEDRIAVEGEAAAAERSLDVLRRLIEAAAAGEHLTPADVAFVIGQHPNEPTQAVPATLLTAVRGQGIRARTAGQQAFVQAIAEHTLTFGLGPAGTGKTFLAIVMAVRALRAREVSRIILSRPAVEAGERLGFLPGDAREKVDPYVRPLYDALAALIDDATVARYIERGTIEVAPLAFMRGRTLADAYVILDEAQNATREQLKMFLTRLGANAKMIVTGDDTQIDLPRGVPSGLTEVERRFASITEIGIVRLGAHDVVRHPLIAKIVAAYAEP